MRLWPRGPYLPVYVGATRLGSVPCTAIRPGRRRLPLTPASTNLFTGVVTPAVVLPVTAAWTVDEDGDRVLAIQGHEHALDVWRTVPGWIGT